VGRRWGFMLPRRTTAWNTPRWESGTSPVPWTSSCSLPGPKRWPPSGGRRGRVSAESVVVRLAYEAPPGKGRRRSALRFAPGHRESFFLDALQFFRQELDRKGATFVEERSGFVGRFF